MLDKLQFNLRDFTRRFPIIFARHSWIIFFTGAGIALIFGFFIFWQSAYLIVASDYEVFVSVRKINTKLYQEALEFIEEQKEFHGNLPSYNPFVK